VANLVAEKVAAEQKEANTKFRAKEVPQEVKINLFQAITSENERRREEVKKESKEKTK
jgi:hypothetical protein